jgi:heavy metal translocating P-type ATPase
MLIELSIIYGSYIGFRFYKRYKESRELKNQKQEGVTLALPAPGEHGKPAKAELQPVDPIKAMIVESRKYRDQSLITGVIFALAHLFPPLRIVGVISYAHAAIPHLRGVERSIRQDRKINVDVLFFVAETIALALGQYVTASFNLWLNYSAFVIMGRVRSNSRRIVTDIFGQLPQKVWILMETIEVEVPLSVLKANDILVVRAGEVIPADGVITDGVASIDQRALTGEAQPAEKGVGDKVLASTIVLTGRLQIKVEKSGQDTVSARIVRVLSQSSDFKSTLQLKGEEWANKATAPMFFLSIPVGLTMGASSAAVFIFSHIGYRIRFLAPLATFNGLVNASKAGILVKDGRIFENIRNIDTVLFDKTGTITTDVPNVKNIVSVQGFKKTDVLSYAATAECKLTHPIAVAITQKARDEKVMIHEVQDSQYKLGYGITVVLGEKTIRVGSSRFINSEGIRIPDSILQAQDKAHELGNTLVIVTVNNRVCGGIELQPCIRPEIFDVIPKLRRMGIKQIAILSGDHRKPTKNLSDQLGMDAYFFDVLPQGKAAIVRELQQAGRTVCFVGDGINDSIAMKKANASVSLRGASSVAVDVAEILLLDGDLSNIPRVIELSQELHTELHRRLTLTLVPAGLNLASLFLFHYGILAALLVNTAFFFIAARNPMALFKELPEETEEL